MVIDRGAFLSGRYAKVYDEIVQVKEACGDAHLKVILEVGELGTYDNVRRASLLAMAAGADFIKTSTGKPPQAATLPVTLVMLEAIRDVHEETGRKVGMKPAGGIRQSKQAVQYLVQLHDTRDRVADARSLQARRLDAAQRRPDADPEGKDRRLPEPGLLHGRLMAGSDARHRTVKPVMRPTSWQRGASSSRSGASYVRRSPAFGSRAEERVPEPFRRSLEDIELSRHHCPESERDGRPTRQVRDVHAGRGLSW